MWYFVYIQSFHQCLCCVCGSGEAPCVCLLPFSALSPLCFRCTLRHNAILVTCVYTCCYVDVRFFWASRTCILIVILNEDWNSGYIIEIVYKVYSANIPLLSKYHTSLLWLLYMYYCLNFFFNFVIPVNNFVHSSCVGGY